MQSGIKPFVKLTNNQPALIASLLLLAVVLIGCTSDINEPVTDAGGTSAGTSSAGSSDTGTTGGSTNTGSYSLTLSSTSVALVEGASVSVAVQVQRNDGYDQPVTLAVEGQNASDLDALSWQFSDTQLSVNDNGATVNINMQISALPIQRQTRTLRIVGTDGNNRSVATVTLDIEPTSLPDVYLLIGQSNMVGFSESFAKQVEPGGDDEPSNRILQLNVTGNDQENFDSVEAFQDESPIAVPSPRFTVAIDPLHDGFDSRINGKEGSRVGLGLSFAKRAILNTQATVYLVPAAWSDSGFCRRPRENFEGLLGWNTTDQSNTALSGTLLYDRAIARANLTLRETGGILRGILWHQGEADSGDINCAAVYEQNMRELVNALRTNIIQDARGSDGRGANANVPFVVGTMSKGGDYDLFLEPKLLVDAVHRNIKQIVPFSAFVNNDDLIPPDFPCGEGDCIHFGSRSYREMGSRYYDFLVQAASNP